MPSKDRSKTMASLLIIAHAPLASAMQRVAQHAFPERTAEVQALDVHPGDAADTVEQQLRALLLPSQEWLILADAFGATPCNAAMRVADGVRSRVVAGVNVPMIWRALCYSHEPLDSVVTRAVAGATQGVMQVASARPQNQSNNPPGDAHVHAHHQQ